MDWLEKAKKGLDLACTKYMYVEQAYIQEAWVAALIAIAEELRKMNARAEAEKEYREADKEEQ